MAIPITNRIRRLRFEAGEMTQAELGERIEKLTDRDTADQCWNQANDGRSTPQQIITKLYRAWQGFQEPAA